MAALAHSIESRVKTMRVSAGRGPAEVGPTEHRHPDVLLLLGLEIAGRVVDGVGGQRVGREGVVEHLGLAGPGEEQRREQQRHPQRGMEGVPEDGPPPGVHPECGERAPGDSTTRARRRPPAQRAPAPCRASTNSLNSRTPMPVGPFTRSASSLSV